MREVMFVDRDWRAIEGRWFAGGYDELGLDVRLERVGGETSACWAPIEPRSASATSDQQVKIYGANLPTDASSRRTSISGRASR